MELTTAKQSLDNIIRKARVHLYKPIQIGEILYRDRVYGDIDLSNLETYRTKSKKWRDIVCVPFLGRTSTSSAKYQDDIFNESAVPPSVLTVLGIENRNKNGIVESYIYDMFIERYGQMSTALNYSRNAKKETFELEKFIDLFWSEPGLKRSLDKIYEIVVYSLFSVIVEELDVQIEVSLNPTKIDVLKEFESFAEKVICINTENTKFRSPASINRVGVTNAADRGLDMWANFGPAIQIKHLSLNEKLAEDIVTTVTSDRIVIVCKDSEESVIKSLLNQLGWKSRIQSIITESELIEWYNKALRGEFSNTIGDKLLKSISDEIMLEFPSSDNIEFMEFYIKRGYDKLSDNGWKSQLI
jgi:type II restriction enzyme